MRKPFNVDNKKLSKAWQNAQAPKSASAVAGVHVLKKDPAIVEALQEMVEPETAGNPMSAEKWVRSSLQHLSDKLKDQGHAVCPKIVGRLLKDLKYSLKANVKRRAGSQHPDRNTQFEYIEAQKQIFLRQGWPIVSLDAKKKELIGNFKNAGYSWCLEAEAVNDHDFESESQGRAVPYRIYDVHHNRGYVYVGQSADTADLQLISFLVGGNSSDKWSSRMPLACWLSATVAQQWLSLTLVESATSGKISSYSGHDGYGMSLGFKW